MNANASSNPGDIWDPTKDPIWEAPVIETNESYWTPRFNSPRCGGWYSIHDIARKIQNWSDHEKARLTSWLIEQRRFGIECPEITEEVIELVKQRNNMSVPDRADAILKYIELKTPKLGQGVIYACRDPREEAPNFSSSQEVSDPFILRQINLYSLMAYSESIDYGDLFFLLNHLQQRKWIEIQNLSDHDYSISVRSNWTYTRYCNLTVEGYARLADIQETKTDSKKGFMAMWFDPSMDQAWREGFEPGIRDAGYEPVRIDQKQHVNRIDDEMIAEIRRSRFMVADFTQDKKGARGGVYYEAGFAHGLGIHVIFTCREDWFDKIHFDVRQYNCIKWENKNLEKLQQDLTNCITAIFGDGPLRSRN